MGCINWTLTPSGQCLWQTLTVYLRSRTLLLNVSPTKHYSATELFANVQDVLSAQLIESAGKSTDLDPRVLEAYIHQCTAEAQEGTFCCFCVSFCLVRKEQHYSTFSFWWTSLVFRSYCRLGCVWQTRTFEIHVFSRNSFACWAMSAFCVHVLNLVAVRSSFIKPLSWSVACD